MEFTKLMAIKIKKIIFELDELAKNKTIAEEFEEEGSEFSLRFAESKDDAYSWGRHDQKVETAREMLKSLKIREKI